MSDCILLVDGMRYGGWTAVEVQRGIEQISGQFKVEYTDRWADQFTPRPIQAGAKVQVIMDGETAITGHVDETEVSYDATRHTLSVSGRDATGDLVDSSAVVPHGGQWLDASLGAIAKDLLNPFGIPLQTETDLGEKFPSFAIQEGETVFEALERAARMRALLLVSDGQGGLKLTRAGTAAAGGALIEGVNILSARSELSLRDRHSEYIVKGQVQALDDYDAEQAYSQEGAATDSTVKRHRPLVILQEDQGYQTSVQQRADWERRVRAGRGARVTVTVQGWTTPAGGLWKPNTLALVRSPLLGIDQDLLIVEVKHSYSDQGTLTELTLGHRTAYDVQPEAKRRKKKTGTLEVWDLEP
jgi:prophage tail gpP-like protein